IDVAGAQGLAAGIDQPAQCSRRHGLERAALGVDLVGVDPQVAGAQAPLLLGLEAKDDVGHWGNTTKRSATQAAIRGTFAYHTRHLTFSRRQRRPGLFRPTSYGRPGATIRENGACTS